MPEPRIEQAVVAGVETTIERLGDGRPVLCLHAIEFGGGREEWRPLAAGLAEHGCEVIAPDWPSPGDVTPDLLHTWLDDLLLQYPEAVDWIARGQAAAYAIAEGQRCRSLTVISPDGLHPEPVRDDVAAKFQDRSAYEPLTSPEAVAAWLSEQYVTEPVTVAEIDAVIERVQRPGAERFFAAWASGALRIDVRHEWIALTQPLLLIWGELSLDPPLDRVDDWIMPLRPDAPVMMIQGRPIGIWKQNVTYKSFPTGPRPHVEKPEAVARVVAELLGSARK